MFAATLLPLPPPASSLLPTLSQPASEPLQQSHPHQHPRRKPTARLNTPLTTLSHDERLIASRKLAIAMYGYSWLKPAGCNKTMLGRREEELEREEVERQLREVELQERIAMEQEEQERQEELRRQAEGGEAAEVGERDLDDEVPEAEDIEEGEDDEDVDEEGEMDGDLDDEIPDADADALEGSWVYDTRREPDTESEGEEADGRTQQDRFIRRHGHLDHGVHVEQDNPTATEAIVNEMLDEDELGEYEHQHDLDDDVPDMDADLDMDMDANLSDNVPEADASASPSWEHTDSDFEESEMDISLLPPHPNSTSRNPGTTHEEMRRISGNRMMPPPPPSIRAPPDSSGRSRQYQRDSGLPQQQPRGQDQPRPRTSPRRAVRAMIRTPATAEDISALISTGGMSTSGLDIGATMNAAADTSPNEPRSPPEGHQSRRPDVSGTRRNLFGGFRGGVTDALARGNQSSTTTSTSTIAQPPLGLGRGLSRPGGVSSGGLFTPSPRVIQGPSQVDRGDNGGGGGLDDSDDDDDDAAGAMGQEPQSRTRSGRVLGGIAGTWGRRRREGGGGGGGGGGGQT